ncbi:Ovostatin homolog [Lemmus lemmus]
MIDKLEASPIGEGVSILYLILGNIFQPEGIEKETSQSFLICTEGDILGVAMQNLDSLFHTPYGCGKQNIAQLASNTYILDYLRATQQLTEEVKSRALLLLTNGEGLSSFCQQRLSALTFKTFEKMKEYIFIEESVPKQTLIWLSRKQRPDGCFGRDDKLANSAWEVRDPQRGVLSLFPWVIIGSASPLGMLCLSSLLKSRVPCVFPMNIRAASRVFNQSLDITLHESFICLLQPSVLLQPGFCNH